MTQANQVMHRDNDAIAALKQALAHAQAELQALKQAHQKESESRAQVENQLKESQQLLQLVMDTLPEAIFWKDRQSVFLGCNQNFADDAGVGSPQNIIGKTDYDLAWKTEESDFYRACDRRVMLADRAELGIIEPQLQGNGQQAWLETNKVPLHGPEGKVIGILGTYQDITARKQSDIALQELNQKLERQTAELTVTLEQLKSSQLKIIQQEKMSALGNLVAGVAHEINNPVGFLAGNLRPAQEYVHNLFTLLDLYQSALPQPGDDIADTIDEIDLEYLREDLPKLISSMHEGVNRIKNISTSLRTFSRADTETKVPFSLREGLDSTLLILKHRLKANEHRPAIEIHKQYEQAAPVLCFPGQLNQVFMNLIANAIDALEEASQGKSFADIQAHPNRITVTTRLSECQQWAVITIQDNGIGMTEATKQKIFENLFTTKGVGKGTGLGLAIVQQIIGETHNGKIEVNSTFGEGTEFKLKIPLKVK